MYEIAFMPDGRPMTEEVIDQYKKKTYLRIATPFPNPKMRMVVDTKEEVITKPIETAIGN